MIKKLYVRNFIAVLISLLLPILILSGMTLYITRYHVQRELTKQNSILFSEGFDDAENTFKAAFSLSLNLSMRENIMQKINYAFNYANGNLASSQYEIVTAILDIIFAIANSDSYIQSIYLYIPNPQEYFLNSFNEIVTIDNYPDVSWHSTFLDKVDENENTWIEERKVERYRDDLKPLEVISVYRKINSDRFPDGVLVLNLSKQEFMKKFNQIAYMGDFLLVSEDGEIMISNNLTNSISEELLDEIYMAPENRFEITSNGEKYLIQKRGSGYIPGAEYISIINSEDAYYIPNIIRTIIIITTLILFFISALVAYRMTKNSVRLIDEIIGIFKETEKGKFTSLPRVTHSELQSYIIESIQNVFKDNDYLNLKLMEKDYELQRLEFMALKSQIRPHFLYNTLEIIKWKSISLTGGQNDISYMLENLSRILRYSFTDTDEMITVSQEISVMKAYENIQRIRYERFYGVSWDIDGDVLDSKIIKFLIQPIMENSFQHGFPADRGLAINVRITALENDILEIVVSDNGTGIVPEKIKDLENQMKIGTSIKEHHIGLINTNRRLCLLYGNEFGLTIKSSVGTGTSVIIRLPLLYESGDNRGVGQ